MLKKLESIYGGESSKQSSSASAPSREKTGRQAIIGPSITIQGDLSGDEDLIIQGRVDGKIELKQHSITIGNDGVVKADVYAKVITVEGEQRGNLVAEEQVLIRNTGKVRGNIVAPRVVLEDGALFKGSIDMETKKVEKLQPLSQGKVGVGNDNPASTGMAAAASQSGQGLADDKQAKSAQR